MPNQKIMVPKFSNICAIMVTYHPDERLPERVERICKQVDKLIIVDNNSSSASLALIKRISAKFSIHLILNEENLGVATALNIGVRYVLNLGDVYEWFLTLDQDSIPSTTMVQNLITAYEACPFSEQIGIIGSNYQEATTGNILFSNEGHNHEWAEVENLPTSGCLTSIRAFKVVGSFRDDLFIDFVDIEYCMRLRENGYRVIIAPKIGMLHPLGYYKPSKLYKFLLGRNVVTNYPPLRHYYWTRNGIILTREYFSKNFKWSINLIFYLFIRRPVTVVLFEENKLLKIRYILLGMRHAFFKMRNNMPGNN